MPFAVPLSLVVHVTHTRTRTLSCSLTFRVPYARILEDLPAIPAPAPALSAPAYKRARDGSGPHYNGKTCQESGHSPADCKLNSKKPKQEAKA